MLRLASIVIGLIVVAGCAPTAPSFETLGLEARTLPVPVRLYNSAAWLSDDRIALAYLGDRPDDTGIVLVDPQGAGPRDVTPAARPECLIRGFMALGRTAGGDLGFADQCESGGARELNDFIALDLDTGRLQSRGPATARPYTAAWAADDSIVYAAGDILCATLYRRADTDGPLQMEVEVDGRRFAAGQDLTKSTDRCPTGGRAGFPAYAPDGATLAFMAASNGDTPSGLGLLDSSWTIFIVRDGVPVPVLAGVTEPRDLVWTAEGDRLLFGGRAAGRLGIWSVVTDGSGLTLVASVDPIDLDIHPGGDAIVAILSSKALANGELAPGADVAVIELPSR